MRGVNDNDRQELFLGDNVELGCFVESVSKPSSKAEYPSIPANLSIPGKVGPCVSGVRF